MALYVYCPVKSEGAFELVKALGATRLRRFDGLHFWDKNLKFGLNDGDIIVNWGGTIPEIEGIRVLNYINDPKTKLEELRTLSRAGVRVIPTLPTPGGVGGTISWNLPRVNYHFGWSDLLNPPTKPDWRTSRLNFTNEYRIHSFSKRSIKAGVRVPREGFRPLNPGEVWIPNANLLHPWIRTYECGWRLDYVGFKSTEKLRGVAHAAIEALGLTFGAVDIGLTPEGTLVVISINKAPNISGPTVQSYFRAITRWIAGKKEVTNEPVEGGDEGKAKKDLDDNPLTHYYKYSTKTT